MQLVNVHVGTRNSCLHKSRRHYFIQFYAVLQESIYREHSENGTSLGSAQGGFSAAALVNLGLPITMSLELIYGIYANGPTE